MVGRLKAIYLGLCLLLVQQAVAQTAQSISSFQRIGSANGLPSNYITSLTRDSRGFYWIGTLQGLCRWDGTRVFVPADQYLDLRSPVVTCLLPYTDSLILIGTYSGLCVYNIKRNKYENYRISDTLLKAGGAHKIETITRLSAGRVLVAGAGGLTLLDPALRSIRYRKIRTAGGIL